jgi:hypothetical protein
MKCPSLSLLISILGIMAMMGCGGSSARDASLAMEKSQDGAVATLRLPRCAGGYFIHFMNAAPGSPRIGWDVDKNVEITMLSAVKSEITLATEPRSQKTREAKIIHLQKMGDKAMGKFSNLPKKNDASDGTFIRAFSAGELELKIEIKGEGNYIIAYESVKL